MQRLKTATLEQIAAVPVDWQIQLAPGYDGDVETIDYDFLIVATGAAHSYFGHGEWAARAPGLKTLDDALEIAEQTEV